MEPRNEREKMVAGELYRAWDADLVEQRSRARALTHRYNTTALGDRSLHRALLAELLGAVGEGAWVEPPFHCDYGWNVSLGEGAFLNFGCVALDCARVEVGALAKLGPGVQLNAATHPVDPEQRAAGLEYAEPIVVGRNVWIAGGVVVGPGVTIGDNSVIGAGSVVIRDVPPNVIAVGNPCRVLRSL